VTGHYCIDTSAWHRRANAAVVEAIVAKLEADEISMCDQVRLEVLYSARSALDYDAIADELQSLHAVSCDAESFERALEVQRILAHVGGLHHRSVTIADLVIAAAAEAAGDIVWHYDEDFDRIAAVTGQQCEWIAAQGSL
jgi:predicted nucleic acid-binding protein